ncbi:MAG: OprO/OprP family phosphate-selective porin [Candidatus Azobacteroides sp.]|nr:OprO/OprP family phosphate-selective porin [Candidatus Azobacteroides sp.]
MKKQLTITLCALMTIGMLYAQGNESKIQKYKKAFQSEAFQLSGYGQLMYNVNEYPERSITTEVANNSIDIVRAFLFATGKLGANNQFGYMLMYDFGPNAKLYELYGEWLPSKAINVRFGQFKTPFTIENPISLSRIETINPSRLVAAMIGSTGDYNQWDPDGRSVAKTGRDAGLQLSGFLFPTGDFSRIEYYAGLFNGTGINVKDNNNHKDFIGTAYFYPIKAFKFGGSFYSGKLPAYLQTQGHLPEDNNLNTNRWTVGAEYKGTQLYGRSEYISAKDGGIKRNGCYGLLLWKFIPNQWEVLGKYDYYKYDYYNSDTEVKNNHIGDLTFGVNYYFAYLSRIQVNYIYSDNKEVGKNNALAVQLQLFF